MGKKYTVEENDDSLYIKLINDDCLLDTKTIVYPDCGYGGYDI